MITFWNERLQITVDLNDRKSRLLTVFNFNPSNQIFIKCGMELLINSYNSTVTTRVITYLSWD